MYKLMQKNYLLPGNIKKLFHNGEEIYNLRRECNCMHLYARTTLRSFYISVCGVKLWNRLSSRFKVKVQGSFICHILNYTGYNQ